MAQRKKQENVTKSHKQYPKRVSLEYKVITTLVAFLAILWCNFISSGQLKYRLFEENPQGIIESSVVFILYSIFSFGMILTIEGAKGTFRHKKIPVSIGCAMISTSFYILRGKSDSE